MIKPPRRNVTLLLAAAAVVILYLQWTGLGSSLWVSKKHEGPPAWSAAEANADVLPPDETYLWRTIETHFPLDKFRKIPSEPPASMLPRVQAAFHAETPEMKKTRLERRQVIKDAFVRCWSAYKDLAWMHDELTPVSGAARDSHGGWATTLVDNLPTLWIMGMKDDFYKAVEAVYRDVRYDQTDAEVVSISEVKTRHLGSLLSAYDLSGDERLLEKARDVGDMLYKAFDTTTHLQVTQLYFHKVAAGEKLEVPETSGLDVGSLCLEFTRLSLLTKDPKYHDVTARITDQLEKSQPIGKLPGMWSTEINPLEGDHDAGLEANFDAGPTYTIGSDMDSVYEYLPKMMALLGQSKGQYQRMYEAAMNTTAKETLFRPMTKDGEDLLFPGTLHVELHDGGRQRATRFDTSVEHVGCYAGGMFALGGALTTNEVHLEIGSKLTEGCAWAYNMTTTGVMPERFHMIACESTDECLWDEQKWYDAIADDQEGDIDPKVFAANQLLPPGVAGTQDVRYSLRPEAIESVFLMYRITGESDWQETGWRIWQAIDAITKTELANTEVSSVNKGPGEALEEKDSMPSYWLSETLLYFYLLYSEPGLVSLDQWVLNTGAHPLRRLG